MSDACVSAANKYYSSAAHHEQKNEKKKKKVKLNFSGHNNTVNKTSLTPFSM